MDVYHRIEKWNGRFYQRGALWQVGAKVYLGHKGKPCPRSRVGLSTFQVYLPERQNNGGQGIVNQVAEQMGLPPDRVLETISDVLQHANGSMSQTEREVLRVTAASAGIGVLDLLQHLRSALSKDAELDADTIQLEADRATAEAEANDTVEADDGCQPVIVEEDVDGEDDNWEDEDSRPAKGDAPRFLPRPPPTDGAGNPFLTVVHTNGFHALPVVWCSCDHTDDRDLQLLDHHLYPASYDRIKTVFTFACLDDHRYNYLECKSSHYQYHNKLRRLTSPQYPDAAPNRYKELCRVARQWRNLKYRKWFWILHNLNAKRGEMALFCAACPQDGINLPSGWMEEMARNP
jgi:hypothetical protein